MILSDTSIPYILYQRTKYLRWGNTFLYSVLPLSFVVSVEAYLFKESIKKKYEQDMLSEFETIKDHIPHTCTHVLDIGCGIAGIDIYIHAKTHAHIHLLDKSELQKNVYYGFERKGAYYNSLDLAVDTLSRNGLDKDYIHTQEVTEDTSSIQSPREGYDLVVSLISWGFHYPVSVYIHEVHRTLSPHGVLILDVRTDSGGEEELRKLFTIVPIKNFGKYIRYLCKKNEQ